ncbi:MAG: molybdenum cofactor biosynthesis protein MoaE [Bryobacteraceae bacterium]|jgi:molybdopterin synthase catalytic subunit
MRARVLFFGVLRDLVGRSSEEADFADGADLGAVLETYGARFPRLKEMAGSIVVARNREFARLSDSFEEGDELALMPPVSGGCAARRPEVSENGNYYALSDRPIDTRTLAARLLTGSEGAVVTFEGTVRNNTRGRPTRFLSYECYEPMALKVMARIGREIAAGREIGRVAMVHRLGRMLVGETSVAVVVTAPHRRPAFEAALEAIDRIKKTVPIWKKEHFADGEVWVEGEWDRDVPLAL